MTRVLDPRIPVVCWPNLARLPEEGTFDELFIADVLGTYDVYGGTTEAALRNGAQVPVGDPILLTTAMAAVTFTDPAKVHPIEHHGEWFDVPEIHISEPSPQRTPVIYQAGASPRGIAFAAGNAEAIFVAAPSVEVLAGTVKRIRDALEAAGRGRYDAKIYTLMTVITGATDEEARAKHADYLQYASAEGALTFLSGWMGVDLSQYSPDEPVGDVESNAIQSAVSHLKAEADLGREWTVGDLAEAKSIGGLGPTIVGSGERIADELQRWVEESDVDGFNLAYAVAPETWEDVIEHVIPVLRARGVYPESYEPGTLRRKLQGSDRVRDSHRAAQYRL